MTTPSRSERKAKRIFSQPLEKIFFPNLPLVNPTQSHISCRKFPNPSIQCELPKNSLSDHRSVGNLVSRFDEFCEIARSHLRIGKRA